MTTPSIRSAIRYFDKENWEKFDQFESMADGMLTQLSRELPPEFYAEIRAHLLGLFVYGSGKKPPKVKVLVDASTIITDAFRVAKGRGSTTEHFFQSPFVEVYAAPTIKAEVERNIINDLPPRASLKAAQNHARKLLAHVNLNVEATWPSYSKAKALIGDRAPEDVPVMAAAIEVEADAIISHDWRAFKAQTEVKHWELENMVKVIVVYESGSLSLFITGVSLEMLVPIFHKALVALLQAFKEVIVIVGMLIEAFVKKAYGVFSQIPEWVWIVLTGVVIGVIIAAIFHEGFRDWLCNIAEKAGQVLASLAEKVVRVAKAVWHAFKTLLALAWHLIAPILPWLVIAGGVLLRKVKIMMDAWDSGAIPPQGLSIRSPPD